MDIGEATSRLRMRLGILAAALLGGGAFLPIVDAPLLGSMDYVQGGQGDGVILVVLAVLGVISTLVGQRWPQVVLGVIALLVILAGFGQIHEIIESSQERLRAAGFRAAADAVRMGWGWIPMFLGGTLMLAAPFARPQGIARSE